MATTLIFRDSLDVEICERILHICNEKTLSDEDEIIIDLSRLGFVKPFGVTYLSCFIYDLLRNQKTVRLVPPKGVVDQYLNDIGFYNEFNIGSDVKVNPRSTSIQIKRLEPHSLDYSYILSLINHIGLELSLSEDIKLDIRNNIIELITNSSDHSKCAFGCYVCAQTYPNMKEIELSIMDFGIGIPANLMPKYTHLQRDDQAVSYSIEEGISSRKGKVAKGTGLAALKRFIEFNQGSIHILSSRGQYKLSKKKEHSRLLNIGFPGTCVCLRINIDDKDYLYIDEEGDIF